MKKSALYTRTGDNGTTSLAGGQRIPKNAPRLEAYGSIDELNSHLGMLIALSEPDPATKELLTLIQNKMFNIGGYLATAPEDAGRWSAKAGGITQSDITTLEHAIDRLDADVPPLRQFVIPAGTPAACQAHIARTVCRRCERRLLDMADTGDPVDPVIIRYINRLSDFLFILARFNNLSSQIDEIFWDKDC